MSLVKCTCIRSADVRTIVLADPACPALDIHARTVADDPAATGR